MKISFILPCYNEEKILEKNSSKVFNYLKNQGYNFDWSLILLINGSDDSSLDIAERIQNNNNFIKLFHIQDKGKGNAIKTFLDISEADFSLYMDIDLAVSLENINDIIKTLLSEDCDLIIGSRLKKGAQTNRSFIRELSSRMYILVSKIIISHNYSDLQCGFKGIKKEAWKKISPHIEDKKWFFDTELLKFANMLKFKVKEIPVNWSENRYEKRKSKVSLFKDSINFIKKLFKLRRRIKKLKNNTIF